MDETSFSQPESSIIVDDSKSNSFFDDPTSHPVLEQKYDWEPGKKLEAPLPDPWYDTRFWKEKYKKVYYRIFDNQFMLQKIHVRIYVLRINHKNVFIYFMFAVVFWNFKVFYVVHNNCKRSWKMLFSPVFLLMVQKSLLLLVNSCILHFQKLI